MEEGDLVDLTIGESPCDLNSKKLDCDKPGCRYGCICHLCLPSAESDEVDQTLTPVALRRTCDKEYCRLGCICDSLEKSGDSVSGTETSQQDVESVSLSAPGSCTKHRCAQRCVCLATATGERGRTEKDPQPLTSEKDPQPLTSIKQEPPLTPKALKAGVGGEQAESSGDELPTLEKTTAPRRQRSTDRYSNLPRRQSSYRVAKNLDAVSRKAMMMWEMSEVYSEQTTTRRKKVCEPGTSPAVTTASPSVPQSPAITSSLSSSSSSASSLTTNLSTHTTNMVTTAVSVNTLPAVMTTSLSMPCSLSTTSTSPTATAVKTSPREMALVRSSASNSVLDTSPVVVSDDDVKPDTPTVADTSVESTPLQVKRSRKRRKVVSTEGEDVDCGAPPRTKVTPGSSAVSAINLSSSLSSSSPEETTRACGCPGPVRQWHTTLICLRANNPTPVSHVSDDVMEEDEIKLVEMIFNCAWEGSKEQILKAITSNVKRGLYPEPRVQIIGGFRVEILPKATKPSAIPLELRSKLPKYMYPVRVKVTEPLKQVQKANEAAHSKDCEIVTPSDASKLKSAERARRVGGDCEVVKLERAGREALKTTPPTGVATRHTSTPSTPLSSVHGGRVPLQGVVPRAGLHGGGAPLSCVLSTPSGAGAGPDTGHSGSMGISGLGHLQISQNKSSVSLMASQGQVLQQHFKIQKKEVVPSPDNASIGPAGGVGEKKRKKKKKKKNMLGDDSLVPDLSNLSVSPRGHAAHLASTTPLTSSPLASSTPNNSLHGTSVKEAMVRPTQPFPLQTVSHLVSSPPSSSLRPQVLGFPSLPATLNNVKFLQLPGQNNLLQIVPASALGLKPMDNKNIPNFVAVPVSLTSITHQNLGPPASKRSLPGKVQGDHSSRAAPSTQPHAQDLSQLSASVGSQSPAKETGGEDKSGATNTLGDGGQETLVKKKKKKKKKKSPVDESSPGESRVAKPVGPLPPPSTLLVAGSPSPVMSCAGSYPVHSMINTHGMRPTLPASRPLGEGASCTSPQKSSGVPDVQPTSLTATPRPNRASLLQPSADTLGWLPSLSERVPWTAGSSHSIQEGGGLHSRHSVAGSSAEGQTSVGPSTSSVSVPSSSCGLDRGRASSPRSLSSVMDSLQEERPVAALDQDSKEPWLDHVYLSSSEEEGLDVGTDPPAPDDVTSQLLGSRSAQEITDMKRNNEQKRRDDLKVWFRKLKGVLSVDGATLPKDISQVQILKKAASIIKYHENWMQSQSNTLTEQKKQQTCLLRQLQTDIDELLTQGLPQSVVDQLLSQVPLPADLKPFQIPCPRSSTLHPHPSMSTSLPHPSMSTYLPHPSMSTYLPHPSMSTSPLSHPSMSTSLPHPSMSTSLPHPSMSTTLHSHPSMSTYLPHPSMSTSPLSHPSMSTYLPHPSMSTSPLSHPSMSTYLPHPSMSTSPLSHPSMSTSYLPHPSMSTSPLPHPSTSTTLHPHPSLSTSPLPPPSVSQPLDFSASSCRDVDSREGKGQSRAAARGSAADTRDSAAAALGQKSCSQAGFQSSGSETQCFSAQGDGVKSGAAGSGRGRVSGSSAGPGCEGGKGAGHEAECRNGAGRQGGVDKHRGPLQERGGAEHHGPCGEGRGERLVGCAVQAGKRPGAATLPDSAPSLPRSVPGGEGGGDEVDGGWKMDSGQDSRTSPGGMQVPVVRDDDILGVADPPHSGATHMGPAQQEESAADDGLSLVITSVTSLRYLGRTSLEAYGETVADEGSEETSAHVSEETSAHVSEDCTFGEGQYQSLA